MFQTQKHLLLRWQYICQQLSGISVPATENPYAQIKVKPVNSYGGCMLQTQKLLLRWQYTCQQLKGMSVQDTETPSTQMVIHLSTVVWDI